MRKVQFRRGSALLIVLGMLSFVLISAIAFSAYMRYSRLPSSYLRRTSASRLLAKAAMAEAIDCIDTAMGNDLTPGAPINNDQAGVIGGQTTGNLPRYRGEGDDPVYNCWLNRCFIGANDLESVGDTASVLSMEALAYIPPPLINVARYYSRRSPAATWHTMGFDAGRFAFAALDVSDYFDVNRVRCNPSDPDGNAISGRNSSDDGRITLAHIFEKHSKDDAWDAFVDKYVDPEDKTAVPFVSMADLNLAMNKNGFKEWSPFCQFVEGGGQFEDNSHIRELTFITDSYCQVTNRSADAIDLSKKKDQPFYGHEKNAKLWAVINDIDGRFWQNPKIANSAFYNPPQVVQLYDYLDEDSIPLSLAFPTVERTPMITGLTLAEGSGLRLNPQKGPESEGPAVSEGGKTVKYCYTPYTLTLTGQLHLNVSTVYPFKYAHGSKKTYKLQAAATIALVPKCVPESEGLLRSERAMSDAVVSGVDNWKSSKGGWESPIKDNGRMVALVRAFTGSTSLSLKDEVQNEADAVLADQDIGFENVNVELVSDLPEVQPYYPAMKCSFRKCTRKVQNPVTKQWEPDPTFTDTTPLNQRLGIVPMEKDLSRAIAEANINAETTYIPTIQVWVRIIDGNDTVDLVPACWQDDKGAGKQMEGVAHDDANGIRVYPLLRFRQDEGVKFDFANGELASTAAGESPILPNAYMTDDPRFNFAPENFITLENGDANLGQEWLKRQRSKEANRDGDIFMSCSDAGYLQSAYELSYLLKITGDSNGGNNVDYGCLNGAYNGSARTAFSDCPADFAMWRTYSEYASGFSVNDIDRLDIINGSRGFRINPYTQSEDIRLAALVNTPIDWWAASTNKTVNTTVHGSTATAKKYAFSRDSKYSSAKVEEEDLRELAHVMNQHFGGNDLNWRDRFDDLGWDSDDEKLLCGVEFGGNVAFHSVDRKFLHGFWKECFDNRQQLFLVFVRAEPMMMGGGGIGQMPPQLGARAVALVWRDPNRPTVSGGDGSSSETRLTPHRSRILFYRQFE